MEAGCGSYLGAVMSPVRVQRKRTKGWKTPLCSCGCGKPARYVGRGTRWGNPWRWSGGTDYALPWPTVRAAWPGVVKTAPLADCVLYVSSSDPTAGRYQAIDHFMTLCAVSARDHAAKFSAWLDPLRGHDLACYCPPDLPCHADVLIDLANGADR